MFKDRISNRYLLAPNAVFSTGNVLHLIELANKVLWESPNKVGCCQDYSLL